MRKRKTCLWIEITVLSAVCLFMAGCTTKKERMEKEEEYRTIGIQAMESGDYTAAMEAFDNALEQAQGIGANEKDICYYKAAAQFAAGESGDAIDTYNALLESDEKARNYTVKGKIYLLKEMYPEAVEALTTAVEKDDVEANLYLAKAYEASGEDTKAEACIDAYIKAYPDSSVAYNQQGREKMQEGNYAEAISEFTQGLSLEQVTNEQELRSNLIAAYEYSGDFEKAKELMKAYVEDYPEDEAAAREYLFLGKNRNEEQDTK